MSTEKNIEQLLKKLGADKKPYPKDLLDARRTAYLSQVTLLASGGPHIKQGNRQGQGGSPPTSAPMTPLMRIVLATLVAANVALAAYLAVSFYENWDKVQELLFGVPAVSETSPISPEALDQAPELETTPEIASPPEGTVVPISTPEPTSSPADATAADGQQTGPSEPEASTPEPKDDPGKHLGQTPHGPGDPPGQDNRDNSPDANQDDQNKDKDKKEKDNNP